MQSYYFCWQNEGQENYHNYRGDGIWELTKVNGMRWGGGGGSPIPRLAVYIIYQKLLHVYS